jgi:hypothetical protein
MTACRLSALRVLAVGGRSLLLFGLVVGLADCDTSAGGPEYPDLGIIVTPDGDVESPQTCLPVPVMPGGRTAKDVTFEPGFSVHLEAERDRVVVTFQGILDPSSANRTLSREALVNGYAEPDIRVETTDHARATVLLVAPCRPETDAGP